MTKRISSRSLLGGDGLEQIGGRLIVNVARVDIL